MDDDEMIPFPSRVASRNQGNGGYNRQQNDDDGQGVLWGSSANN